MTETFCFVTQEATEAILERVSKVCGECYSELEVGETIHYDTNNYRFLCECCKQKVISQMDEECNVIYDEADPTLFC